ncbi:Zinc finger protein 414 [Apodemus speciosus]|uniref:Zinc finger protein 414 n=1 Tax=Apodemus speciosus TaxID=105296 RepID=A0ABQ0FNV6_APOSI
MGSHPDSSHFSHQEEPSSRPSADTLATVESSSSEPDKAVASPDVAATASFSSPVEEPGPNPTATPAVWECGGPLQQIACPASESCQTGSANTGVGTNEDLRLPRRRPPPGYLWSFLGSHVPLIGLRWWKQIPCSSPGCCLSFPSVRDLAQHLRTHCPPTQSLEGKVFRCSALSCTESFPSMQELVAHGKLHYKPNRYFNHPPPPPPALDKEPPVPERPPDPPRLRPFLAATPGPPASGAAVWRKSQGVLPVVPEDRRVAPMRLQVPSRSTMTLCLQDRHAGDPAALTPGLLGANTQLGHPG